MARSGGPGAKPIATEGLAVVQQGTKREKWGLVGHVFAVAASIFVRQVAANMDMLALLSAVVTAPRPCHGGLVEK